MHINRMQQWILTPLKWIMCRRMCQWNKQIIKWIMCCLWKEHDCFSCCFRFISLLLHFLRNPLKQYFEKFPTFN
jgi:hypothetical protein